MNIKTDASTNILGFEYQKMVALLKCLEAPDDAVIYLECDGADVSDGTILTETKHSINPEKKLTNFNIDFWKTLSNFLEVYESRQDVTKFILHTTAKIPKDSIFENWNSLDASEKRNNILNISPHDGIREYYDKASQSEKLNDVLAIFDIETQQKNAHDLYFNELLKHPAIINFLEITSRKALVESLIGYITILLVRSKNYRWEIKITDFRSNFQAYFNNIRTTQLTFPISECPPSELSNTSYRFVDEIKKIQYQGQIANSIKDYVRSQQSREKILTKRQCIGNFLDAFDSIIKENFEQLKISHQDQFYNSSSTEKQCIFEKSRRFFDITIEKTSQFNQIEGVTSLLPYYSKGRLFYNIEKNEDCYWYLENKLNEGC